MYGKFVFLQLIFNVVSACYAATEVLHNNNFESSNFNGNWYCSGGCKLAANTDSYEGLHSVKVSNRDHRWKGLTQDINVQGGHLYKLTAYMKLLNVAPGNMYEEVETMVACALSNGHQKFHYFGSVPMMQANNEWYEVGGVKELQQGSHSCKMYFQTSAGVDYLVDKASMTEVTANSNWKAQADLDIDRIRKSNITISLTGHGVGSSSLDIELVQTKHEFGFGSAMRANEIVEASKTNYLNAFVDNFEWAVPTNFLKWFTMEYNKGHVNYNTALTAINLLKSKGIKVRGHAVFWGVDDHVQPWVKALSKQDLLTEMDKHIKGVIGHTKGLLEHWDVNNENLHGDFYERRTGNKDITMDMFRQVHAEDSHPKLFLNEYGIVVNANKAVALKDQAKRFRAAGVPIYGVGVQSHLPGRVDITALKARLDIVAEAGLPIWITELTVSAGGDILRASTLSDVMHLYFSHPSVEGILLWGFWDGEIHDKSAALFQGQNVTPNRAGKVWQQLVKEQWRTNVTSTIHGTDKLNVRGFKGTYNVTVKNGGRVLKTETFTLGKDNLNLHIHLSHVSGSPSVSHIVVG